LSPPPAEPRHAFDESRRLIGANRWYAGPAVTLVPLGPAAADGAAQGRWIAQVVATCAALGWPAPEPRVHAHAQGVLLAFAAPAEALMTATEVNEWAWERAAAAHPQHAAEGFDLAQPAIDDALEHFRSRAEAERSWPLQRLQAAAAVRRLPLLADDDSVSIGEGHHSRVYPRGALPLPMDVPWAALGPVPKVLVTGSNGKTTTTRLLAAMARAAGFVPGSCSTEGVVVGTTRIDTGDWSGPAGARAVLRHPAVTAAVLETARGGLLRRGLAVSQADVAVVTNVSADHLGEHGIDTVEDIAFVKLAVAHALARPEGQRRGTLVLNGQCDPLLRAAVQVWHLAQPTWALFAREHDTPLLAVLRHHGGSTCAVRDGQLLLSLAGTEHELGAVADMPLTLGGAAGYNIENLAAAALAAAALGWPLDEVRQVLARFGAEPSDNPGRLERHGWRGATVLVDYAHNPDGLAQLLGVARSLLPVGGAGRLLLLLGQAGNRDDEAIAALAEVAAAAQPDLVVLKELTAMLRGRDAGAVPALLHAGLLKAALPASRVVDGGDESDAAGQLLQAARPGDVVVLPLHTTAVRDAVVARLRAG
jgi:UDP-N-acetylmuramyl tripeptide synthase